MRFARTSDHRFETLRELEMFAACSRRELAQADTLMTKTTVPAGAVLTREDKPGRECFIVTTGGVLLERDGEAIGVNGPGSWLGEMALLDREPRTATARTIAPTTLFVLSATEFASMVQTVPSVRASVLSVAEQRRRHNRAR
jgi:CRP-like cAMP-binding protein